MKKAIVVTVLFTFLNQANAQFSAGIARIQITPETPVWLSGYAARTRPADEVLHDLWAKAVVISDNKKNCIVIVTLDIIGLSHGLSEEIISRVIEKHGLTRSQVLINSSHTHSGPVIWPSLSMMFELGIDDKKALIKYSKMLADDIIEVIDMAFLDLKPSTLSTAHSEADFAVNRRKSGENGVVIGVNNEGPVDHDVPVMMIESDGKLRAVLFGYACHNTTLDIYQVNGDYAGFAQVEFEKVYPGVIAMYMAGCGADQNPNPRRTVELAIQHGRDLSRAVQMAVEGERNILKPPLRTSFTSAQLDFLPVSQDEFREEIFTGDRFGSGRATFMLEALDKGYDIGQMSYPVQVVRFGKGFTILALAGEVVVDYSINTKRRYSNENLFVAGYSSEVQCYIPSARILNEGGYEPETSMIYYGLPGPFDGHVEEKVFNAIDYVMKKAGAKPDKKIK